VVRGFCDGQAWLVTPHVPDCSAERLMATGIISRWGAWSRYRVRPFDQEHVSNALRRFRDRLWASEHRCFCCRDAISYIGDAAATPPAVNGRDACLLVTLVRSVGIVLLRGYVRRS